MGRSTIGRTKASGIDWIGEIPEHWDVKRLKFIASFAYGDGLSAEARVDGDVPVYGSNGVVGAHDQPNTHGPVIIVGRKGSYGKINLSEVPAFAIDTTYYVDDRVTKADIRWLAHVLGCLRLDAHSKDSAVPGLAREDAYEKYCPVPPGSEQMQIVDFLDRETARIDALIEKKRRLLELLEEERLAVITHAVTKGLDPSAPMKDSGIDWLGQIPAHWSVRKIKYAVSHVVDCLHTTPHYEGDLLYPAVRTADLDRGRLLLDQARLVSHEVYLERIQRLKPEAGDVLYSREGERFGMAALVPQRVDLCLGQRMMMFRVHSDMDPGYLMWALNSEAIYQQVILFTGGSTSPHINIEDVINFSIPHPPLREQHEILRRIGDGCASIDRIKNKVIAAISKLTEYRSALITNAVTGKIDVREAKQKEAAE